ncbi:MAG: Lrp/AsnC ligand binding domain-containing protein, partial [Bacteroidetes bacterium]|nr:Lrp/AsnC ligand binding domain-containing protein [Bacteroidota bacterium]
MADYRPDALDRKILVFLEKNARTPFVEIARECNISAGAVNKRIQKLETAGVIKGFKMILNPVSIGYKVNAFVGVYLERANMYTNVKKRLGTIPEVVELHFTTGKYGVLAKLICRDNEHLKDVLLKIHELAGVATTETFISIEQSVYRQ